MYNGKQIGVVVPAYNEEGFVGDVIETVPEFVDRVYVVDDASTDGTWDEIAEHVDPVAMLQDDEIESRWERLRDHIVVAIQHTENTGVGGAIKTGYERARADDVDVVAVMSGDGQMDPDILDRIIQPVVTGEAEYAKGNRLIYAEYRSEMLKWRFFGNSLLSLLTKIASGYWRISDPQNGYTAISTDALDKIKIQDLYDDYGFANHLLIRLNAQRMRIADVSMSAVYGDESSSIEYRSFVPKLSSLLLRSFLWRLKMKYVAFEFNPLVLYYALGVLSIGAGAVAGTLGVVNWLRTGAAAVNAIDVTILVLLGGYALATAMQLDWEASADLEFRLYDPPQAESNTQADSESKVLLDNQE